MVWPQLFHLVYTHICVLFLLSAVILNSQDLTLFHGWLVPCDHLTSRHRDQCL